MARPLLSINTPARMLLLGLASVLLTGCSTPDVILWTPDSSSIIYSDDAGRLIRYDLTRKARKIIVADTKTDTPWPAISKDGKKLAVANITTSEVKGSREAKHKLQLIFYDSLSGEKLSETKVHEYTTNLGEPAQRTTEDRQEEAALNWSGPPDKVLVVGGSGRWIYDLEKDNFIPIQGYPFPIYNRPVRPDGKGFLAFFPTKDGDSFVFYDWNGWETSIGKWKAKQDEQILHCVWKKNIYQMSTTHRVVSIDTENRKITERQVKPNFLASSGELMVAFPFAGSDSQLCVFRQSKKDGGSRYHVEIQRPLLKQRKVVVTIQGFHIISSLFPSPDNKLVAIRCSDKGILVINAEGEIVANIAR